MNRDRDLIVAVDIGASRMSAGLMTLRGELIDRAELPVDRGLSDNELFESLLTIIDEMLRRADDHHQLEPIAIGVGCVGPIVGDVETVSPTSLDAWRTFPLRSRLEEATSLPVYGGLDATSLALAEGWLGAAQGRSNFLAVVVSSSISGGVVIDGQLLEGASGNAGHIGHVMVEPNGRRCWCGARGCLEAEASGRAIEVITGRPPTEPSYETMQRTGELVGRAVASVCNLLDLDLAVVGGPVALGFGATFFNSAQAALDRHARVEHTRGARITPARLGDRGPLLGAGAMGLRGVRRHGLRSIPARRSLLQGETGRTDDTGETDETDRTVGANGTGVTDDGIQDLADVDLAAERLAHGTDHSAEPDLVNMTPRHDAMGSETLPVAHPIDGAADDLS